VSEQKPLHSLGSIVAKLTIDFGGYAIDGVNRVMEDIVRLLQDREGTAILAIEINPGVED